MLFNFLWPDFASVPQEFDESYVQTGQGQLYSWSSQNHQRGGSPMVLRCNHTIIYEGQEERQGPVLQLLKLSRMNSVYNMFTLTLDFHITASLGIPGQGKNVATSTHTIKYITKCWRKVTPLGLCLQMVMKTHALKALFLTQPPIVLVCCFNNLCLICLLAAFIWLFCCVTFFLYDLKICSY